MRCPRCQSDNREDAQFCLECGEGLELTCPRCGRTLPVSARFCDRCRHDLTGVAVTPPIDYAQPHTYTPKFLADKILTARDSIEGERKIVTVLFADVAGYTSMSEKLDPEEVHQIMDGCFKILMDEIHRFEGTIDKFTGDGVMALFGAPVAHEDHAQRACYSALAIQRALAGYGEKVEKDCGSEFKMRVGLNSGPVIVGSVGNDLRMDYTAIGDTTNLASRMQTMATPGGVLVSADTHRLARDFFRFQPLGKLSVKGKHEPQEAFELIEPGEVETRIGASVAKGLTKFVGRRREISALKEAFEQAQSGSGQLVCIVGEAGVGKSRLLLELRKTLPTDGHMYLEGRCLHYGGSMAYLPVIDILRAYFDIDEGDREYLAKKKMQDKLTGLDGDLTAILPPLHELLSLKVDDAEYADLDPQKKKERTFEAVRDLLIRESGSRTLVLAVEDLHWIDRISQDFLSYLIDWLPGARILLILLYRPEYAHPWASKSCYSQVRVDQLSTGTSAELVHSILEEGEVAPELRELILNRAAGNPLFMEEFTHTLLENGCIERKDHEYVLTREPSDICVPDTIQGIIAARMDRLEDNLKRTMQVASVIGRDFAYRILHTITGMQEELKSYLLNLQGLEFIYEKSLFPELEYVFKHALTQEVAYSSLLLKRRKEIHERIGKAIEELYPDRLDEFYEALAFHFRQGESLDKALDYLIKSAEKSSDRYAVQEAHGHFQGAFDILSAKANRTKEEDALLIDLLIKWAYVFYHRGDFRGLSELLTAHRELAESLGDKVRLGMFYGWLGFAIAQRNRLRESYEYLGNALKLGEETGDRKLIGYACTWLAWTCIYLGLLDEALAHAERAQEISRALETDHYLYFKSMAGLACAHWFSGEKRKTLAAGEAILEYGQRHNSVRSLVMGHLAVGWAHEMDDDPYAAIESYARALEVAADPFYALMVKTQLGVAYAVCGRIQEAEQLLREGQAFCRDFGLELVEAILQACLAFVAFGSETQPGEAMEQAENALRALLETESKSYTVAVAAGMGILYVMLVGQDPEAERKAQEHLKRTIELGGEIGNRLAVGQAYRNLGLLHEAKGEKDRAREYIATAIQLFEECEADNRLREAKEALESLG